MKKVNKVVKVKRSKKQTARRAARKKQQADIAKKIKPALDKLAASFQRQLEMLVKAKTGKPVSYFRLRIKKGVVTHKIRVRLSQPREAKKAA